MANEYLINTGTTPPGIVVAAMTSNYNTEVVQAKSAVKKSTDGMKNLLRMPNRDLKILSVKKFNPLTNFVCLQKK